MTPPPDAPLAPDAAEDEAPAAPARPWAPFALVGAAFLLLVHRVWLFGETYYLRDFWVNYVPSRYAVRQALVDGGLLLWNPWMGGGLPTAPDPCTSLFYPLAWPFLLPSNQAWAYSVLMDVHLLLAFAGTFVLARKRVSAWAATAAGVAFAFGGLMLSNRSNGQFQLAYAWVPFWFAALDWLLTRLGERRPVTAPTLALGGIWALQLLASDPQTAYVEGLAIGFVVLAQVVDGALSRRQALQALGLCGAAVALSVSLAAPQLLAMFEALPYISRQAMTAAESAHWSFHLLRLWELVVPMPWGELAPVTRFWGKALVVGPHHNFYFTSTALTVLALPLLALGARVQRRGAWALASGVAVLLLASLGTLTPLHAGLRAVLPLWEVFRYPERLLVVPSLAAAVLLGRGVDAALVLRGRGRLWLLVPGAAALVAMAAPTLLGPGGDEPVSHAQVISAALQTAGVALGATAALWFRPHLRAAALATVLIVDVFATGVRLQASWVPPSTADRVTASSGRLLVIVNDVNAATAALPAEPALRRELEDATSRPNLGPLSRARTTNAVTSLQLKRKDLVVQSMPLEQAALHFATSRLVARPGLPFVHFAPTRVLTPALTQYDALAPPSEVACATGWDSAVDPQGAVASVKAGRHVIEGAPAAAGGGQVACTLTRVDGRTLEVALSPQPTPTLVRVSETWFPGWVARIDDAAPVPALPADLTFQGVVAPAGARRVVLRYQPAWRAPAAVLCSLGVLASLAALLWARRRGSGALPAP